MERVFPIDKYLNYKLSYCDCCKEIPMNSILVNMMLIVNEPTQYKSHESNKNYDS